MDNDIFKLNEDMIYRKMGEQRILVPIGTHIDKVRSIFTLNETAAHIFDDLKAGKNFEQLADSLYSEFDFANLEAARSAVRELIDELKQHHIIL